MTIPSLPLPSSTDDSTENCSKELAAQDSIDIQTTRNKKKKNKNKAKNQIKANSSSNRTESSSLSSSLANTSATQTPSKPVSSKAMMEKDGFKLVTRGSNQTSQFQSIAPTMSMLIHQLEESSESDNEMDVQLAAALTVEDDFGGFME